MFWFTALNEPFPEFAERNRHYREMLKVALLSAKLNAPGLKPVLIYNGREEAFHDELRTMGCEVIFHRLSIEDAVLNQATRSDLWKDTARGAFLRLDIPELFPSLDEALYTDLDVLFLNNPTKFSLKTRTLALAPEFQINDFEAVNTGSMLFNCKGVKSLFKEILDFSLLNLEKIPDYDQGAIRLCLSGRWDRLSPLMNWKPYWGVNRDAIIVHFHGPKPWNFDSKFNLSKDLDGIYSVLFERSTQGYGNYLREWKKIQIKNEPRWN